MQYHVSPLPLSLAVMFICAACASQPKQETVTQVAQTESTIRQAEQLGAQQNALPELQQAKNKLADAQEAMHKKDETKALRLAQQSQVDAQYAAAKAQAIREQQAATETSRGVNTMRDATDASPTPPPSR